MLIISPLVCTFLARDSDKSDILARKRTKAGMTPPQWINCDIRYLDLSVLGKFSVIMADPPWDIHMELPYGTMTDEEMKSMRIKELSDDGLFFLWVSIISNLFELLHFVRLLVERWSLDGNFFAFGVIRVLTN